MSDRGARAEPGGFFAETRDAGKVLVVDLGFLGDMVHLVPALWEIERHYPKAALHVLTSPIGAEVLLLAPCVDRTWVVELAPGRRTVSQHAATVRALRRERFDVAFNFSGADRTLILTALSGARRSVTHEAGRRHFWNGWLAPERVERRSSAIAVFEQRRAVLAACGFDLEPARFDLSVPGEARSWAELHVPRGATHVSVNTVSELNEWPLSHWAALLRRLPELEPGVRVVATGGDSERERARLAALEAAVARPYLRVFSGLTVPRLAALLERSARHLGSNSGALHLAAALGVPTLSLFRDHAGATAWIPRGPLHRQLLAACPCATEGRDSCRLRGEAECLSRLSPEEALAALAIPPPYPAPVEALPS